MTVLSRPAGEKELELTAATGGGSVPPVVTADLLSLPLRGARNTDRSRVEHEDAANGGVGCVVRTDVRNDFITRQEDCAVREREPLGIGIPPEKLDEGQRQHRSPDRVTAEHRGPGLDRDPTTSVPLAAENPRSGARFGTVAPCIAGAGKPT